MLKIEKNFKLKDIVLIGRRFDEYYKIFDLKNVEPNVAKILDVGGGVSSFCSEGNLKGYNITSSDRIYCFSPDEIREKCMADLNLNWKMVREKNDMFIWTYYKNVQEWKENRSTAYNEFLNDYRKNLNKKYIYTDFPESSFENNEFTLSLVSHFLFLYDEHLDYEFHKKTINEIIRVTSKEIRIFPIVNLRGKRSVYIQKIIDENDFKNYNFKIEKVDYEFFENANEMLVIKL